MKIIGSSVNGVIDTFLHSGYISAYPPDDSPLSASLYPGTEPLFQLDMAEALKLKSESVFNAVSSTDTAALSGWISNQNSLTTLLGSILILAGSAIAFYMVKKQFFSKGKKFSAALISLFILTFFALIGISCGDDENEKVKERGEAFSSFAASCGSGENLNQYEDPELATKAILYGIVETAYKNSSAYTIEGIKNEVGLPLTELTPGMKQALRNFCYDGWGHKIKIENDEIVSAGLDGFFNTEDDIKTPKIYADFKDEYSWRYEISVYFLTKMEDKLSILFHTWSGKGFSFNNEDESKELTGGNLFDLWQEDNFSEKNSSKYKKAVSSYRETAGEKENILVLQVFN